VIPPAQTRFAPHSVFFRLLRALPWIALFSAALATAETEPTAYARTAAQRAEKITATLALNDPAKATRVQAAIARQYLDLHALHATRDARIAAAKALPDKAAATAGVAAAKASIDPELATLHAAYLARLAAELTPSQIDQVKDGMTYGVLPLTFRVYQQMLPDLTAAQKAQLLAWLTEAREHAMDGSTSDEKHAWFGKYKGKINNYLSAAGYDMKQAEKDLSKKP
jgi:hypothetical protein